MQDSTRPRLAEPLGAHFPFDCGAMTDLYPLEWLERVREEIEN